MSSERVYLMQHELGPIKIGVSKNPERRLKDVDIGPFEVRLVGVLESERPRKLENALHRFHADDNIRGEWFDLNIDQIENIFAGNESERWLGYVVGDYGSSALFPAFNVDSLDNVVVAKPYSSIKGQSQIEELHITEEDEEAAKKRRQTLMWQGLVG